MSLRWNIILCVSILFLAGAFVAGVLFFAGSLGKSTGASSGQVAAGKPLLGSKVKVLPKVPAEAKSLPKTTGMHPTEPNKTVIATTGIHPTESNMTVIATTGGNLSYSGNNVEVDVTNPPLLIDLTIIPKIVTETKWFVNRSLTRKEEVVQVPVVSPSSFASVSVIEKETGRIIAQEGFGNDDSTDTSRAIKVYEPGRYLVQLYGNDVAVQALLSMRTPGLTF